MALIADRLDGKVVKRVLVDEDDADGVLVIEFEDGVSLSLSASYDGNRNCTYLWVGVTEDGLSRWFDLEV